MSSYNSDIRLSEKRKKKINEISHIHSKEVRAKKAELLRLVIEKNNKIDHGFGHDGTTAEMDGKIYVLEYVLGVKKEMYRITFSMQNKNSYWQFRFT